MNRPRLAFARQRKRLGAGFAALIVFAAGGNAASNALGPPAAAGRVVFHDSIKEVPVGAPAAGAHRVRETLTADELRRTMGFVVSLKMRDFPELQARIQSGRTVPHADMEARYLPLKEDYGRVSAWLVAQGFKLTLVDPNHTNVFANGTVAQVSAAFGVTFARVATADGEFTSAISAPSIPGDLADVVLGVDGLQPHIRMHVPRPQGNPVTNFDNEVTPADITAGYNVPGTYDGTGQTIAIIMDAAPAPGDLTAFWADVGISRSGTATYTVVDVSDGTYVGPTSENQANDVGEATLDTEWSTGIAPGAALRLYAIPSLGNADLLEGCTQVLSDGIAKVVSYSAAGAEDQYTANSVQANSQEFAQMASAGITMLVSSGDSGSNPNTGSVNGYSASNTLSVMYPPSDPNVTGVGGTTPTFDANWAMTSEVVWSEIGVVTTNPLATGGGVSALFPKPIWQAGGTLIAGQSNRCVPDVAAMASASPTTGNGGAFVVLNGQLTGYIGTSLASPIWAGLAAVIDQARAGAGRSTVGLLGPYLYPLYGTSAFNAITSGSNGAYSGGAGYNFCTGLGSPNIANIIAQIGGQSGIGDTATGVQALNAITTGAYNVGNGYQALYNDTTGNNNTAVGTQALLSNATGSQNVAIGFRTLDANSSGTYNTANGYDALPANATGNGNTASGFKALFENTTGSQNTASGYRALFNNNGQDNAAVGWNALEANTSGTENAAIGSQALYANSTGSYNAAAGYQALSSNTAGQYDTALGAESLPLNTTGNDNSALGTMALASNATGSDNSAFGALALFATSAGTDNVAGGYEALYSNSIGNYNVAVGGLSLHSNSSGVFNVGIGKSAGSALTTGFEDIDIGNAGVAGESGVTRIGTATEQTSIAMAGIYGAAIGAGNTGVYVDPNGYLGTVTSSETKKTDVRGMGAASAVALALRPVSFRYSEKMDPTGTPQFGLVAEEVERVAPELVVYDGSHRVYSVRYGAVDVMLLNEFRSQREVIREQEGAIAALKGLSAGERREIQALKGQVASLRGLQREAAGQPAELDALAARVAELERAIAAK